MSIISYAGEGAGLGRVLQNGDRNNPANYDVTCPCGTYLGPMARFLPNADGVRTAFCPKSDHLVVIDKNAQVSYCEVQTPEQLNVIFGEQVQKRKLS